MVVLCLLSFLLFRHLIGRERGNIAYIAYREEGRQVCVTGSRVSLWYYTYLNLTMNRYRVKLTMRSQVRSDAAYEFMFRPCHVLLFVLLMLLFG